MGDVRWPHEVKKKILENSLSVIDANWLRSSYTRSRSPLLGQSWPPIVVVFLGMLEARPSAGGVVGPTIQCIQGEQFRRTKIGDRFWHENAPNSALNTDRTAFTPCQLREIRKTLLSKITCDNGDEITAVQRYALQQSDIKVPCNKLPRVNLEPWLPNFQCDIR